MINHGYNVCFLDILGFSNKICSEGGLDLIKNAYLNLTKTISGINGRYEEVTGKGIIEGAYWSSSQNGTKNDVGIFYPSFLLYGSDSIIIWSNRTWEMTEKLGDNGLKHPANKWMLGPKPCDPFLTICNEIICKSIELGLPLRGAISTGEGYFDFNNHIFIGKPIVEAVKLEPYQHIIGASFCRSFENQIIPTHFKLQFDNYLKNEVCKRQLDPNSFPSETLLDWPRHWLKTRETNIVEVIKKIDFGDELLKQQNTIRFIEKSQYRYISNPEEKGILENYSGYYDMTIGLPIRMQLKNGNWVVGDFSELNNYISNQA